MKQEEGGELMSMAQQSLACRGRRVFSAAMSVVLAAALSIPIAAIPTMEAQAETITVWPSPTAPLSAITYNDDGTVATQLILGATRGAYLALPNYVGLTNPTANAPTTSGMIADSYSLEDFETCNEYGTFASAANQSPDVYWSNLWYTYVNPDSGLDPLEFDEVAMIIEGRGIGLDTDIIDGFGTSATFAHRPDIVMQGAMGTTCLDYMPLIEDIRDGSIGAEFYQEGDEDYDPYLFDFAGTEDDFGISHWGGSARGNMSLIYSLADAIAEIQAEDSTKITRFGDAQEIAMDLEEMLYGLQYYLLAQFENGSIEEKVVAVISSIDSATQTADILISNPNIIIGTEESGAATSHFGPQHVLKDITTNLVDVLGVAPEYDDSTTSYTVTVSIQDLTQADVLMCTSGSFSNSVTVTETDLANAFEAAGVAAEDRPVSFHNDPDNMALGGWSSDRLTFLPAWISFIYPELGTQAEIMSYYYYYFVHIAEDYLDDVLALNCGTMTLREGQTIDEPAEGFMASFDEIKAMCVEGMRYFAANQEQILSEHPGLTPIQDADGSWRNARYDGNTYDGGTYEEPDTSTPAENSVIRLSGSDRYQTMADIVSQGFDSADTVIVTTGENYPDALAASGLAGVLADESGKGVPIVTTGKDALSSEARSAILAVGASNVIVLGDSNAVSNEAYAELESMNLSVKRVSGSNRIATAIAIFEEGGDAWSDTAIVTNGSKYPDALSISSYAYATGSPIFLTDSDGTLNAETIAAIDAGNFSRLIILGDENSVASSVETRYRSIAERVSGANRYATSAAIANMAIDEGVLSASVIALATGENFPDALAGGALCGEMNAALILVNDSNTAYAAQIVARASGAITAYVFGDTNAVSNAAVRAVTGV